MKWEFQIELDPHHLAVLISDFLKIAVSTRMFPAIPTEDKEIIITDVTIWGGEGGGHRALE